MELTITCKRPKARICTIDEMKPFTAYRDESTGLPTLFVKPFDSGDIIVIGGGDLRCGDTLDPSCLIYGLSYVEIEDMKVIGV